MPHTPDPGAGSERRGSTLVIGCGALGRELAQLVARDGLDHVRVRCLPASLHNRPERIAPAVEGLVSAAQGRYEQIFVAYADCGTGGGLDRVLARYGVERLPGAHCYQAYAGLAAFDRMADEEPGTFYLTDFLVRSFDRLVIAGLGLDRHPELLPQYFAGYRRVVYLAQRDDPALTAAAERAAARLGLVFERRHTGLGELRVAIERLAAVAPVAVEPPPAAEAA